ncbi:MAG: ATPase [Sphingomicrobium sp.]
MKSAIAAAMLLGSASAQAEVLSANSNGFHVRQAADLAVAPAEAFRRFGQVGSWWNPQHSYSGDSKNLGLSLLPGACFCEKLPGGGGVEHLRVTYYQPGKRLVMSGALGPLLFEAAAGVMDVQIEPTSQGSRITMNYKAAGFAEAGADKLAPLVDTVLGDQVKRFAAYASSKP